MSSGGRACEQRGKATPNVAGWRKRRAAPAGRERPHGDQDASSNWRNPPHPAGKAAEAGEAVSPAQPGSRPTRRGWRRGSESRGSGGRPVERRDPAVGNSSIKKGGTGEMTKAPIRVQDLSRRIYSKAKAEPTWRFCKRKGFGWKRWRRQGWYEELGGFNDHHIRRPAVTPKALGSAISHITLDVKGTGKRSAGNPHAAFERAGIGDGLTERLVRHSQRKRGVTDRSILRGVPGQSHHNY